MINQPFSFRTLPPAVRALIVVNVGVFILQWIVGPRLTAAFGLAPARVLQDLWLWQIGTYMFLHGGFFHLLFNMFVLWTFGREVETQWGAGPFLRYYLLCGWGAGVLNVLLSPSAMAPSVGASGAIYGLLVAFAILFPHAVMYLYFLIPLKARQVVILMAAVEFLASFSSTGSGVANFAHLGGMATGYLYLKSGSLRWKMLAFPRKLSGWVRFRSKERTETKVTELSAEVDRILDKILKEGLGSLTAQEQELMRRYSKMKK